LKIAAQEFLLLETNSKVACEYFAKSLREHRSVNRAGQNPEFFKHCGISEIELIFLKTRQGIRLGQGEEAIGFENSPPILRIGRSFGHAP